MSTDEFIWEEQWKRASHQTEKLVSLGAFGEKALNSFGKWINVDDQLILEAGSGTGRFCLALAEQYPESEVIGLDNSMAAVDIGEKGALQKGIRNASFEEGDIFDLPFSGNTFDVAFNEGVIEHFLNYRDAVDEMVRVTKPGGKVIISVPNWYCFPHTIYKRLKGDRYQYGYEKSFRTKELVAVFKELGLTDIEVSGFDPAYGINRIHRLSKLGQIFDRFVVNPLDVITKGMFSKKFGFEICVKGVKPSTESDSYSKVDGISIPTIKSSKEEPSDLRGRALKGVMWTGVSQIVTQLFQFIFMVILARILLPRDFGTVGMAFIFTGLINMVNELGLTAAIIQKRDINDNHLSTAFWFGIGVGILSWLISVAAAPAIASFFKRKILERIVILISVGFVVNSLGTVHKTLLNKNLDFKKISIIEILSALFYGASTITLSILGFGVWSLVFGYLISLTVEVLLLWFLSKWKPRLIFHIPSFRELFSFGVNVWFFNFINYGRENIDYFTIGRYLGATPLGFYTLAYNLANLPRRKLSTIITRVTFPAFSKIQDENEKLSKIYLKTTSYISLVTFPLLTGLIVIAPEFIRIVYGVKWIPMILTLQLLCIAGMLYSIGTTVGSIYLSKGRPDIQLKIGIAAFIFLTTFVLIGIRFGVNGVAGAVTLYTILSLGLGQYFANSLINLKMKDYFLSLLPASFGSVVMVVLLLGFRLLNNYFINLNDVYLLIASILTGGLIYLTILKIFNFKEFKELLGIIKEQIAPLKNRIVFYVQNKHLKKEAV